MIRWFPEVWTLVSDAELQSLYYSSCTDRARELERLLRMHPDYTLKHDFQTSLVEEMAWRWMEVQAPKHFFISSQDPDVA